MACPPSADGLYADAPIPRPHSGEYRSEESALPRRGLRGTLPTHSDHVIDCRLISPRPSRLIGRKSTHHSSGRIRLSDRTQCSHTINRKNLRQASLTCEEHESMLVAWRR